MKKIYLTISLFTIWYGLTSTKIDPGNPQAGNTGAPSETTCQKSNCHSGGTFTGSVAIAGVPDTVLANTSYMITLTQTSNAVRSGFQLTCLDKLNAKCGTLVAGTGVNVTTSNNRQYARQSAAKLLASGSANWIFTWKSPATLPTDSVKFYFSSLAANNNNAKTGDNVLLGTKKVIPATILATDVAISKPFAKMFPTILSDVLTVDLSEMERATLTIFDQNGRAIRRQVVQNGLQNLSVSSLSAGVYSAQLLAENGRSQVFRLIKK
jgi:hypothetical protein